MAQKLSLSARSNTVSQLAAVSKSDDSSFPVDPLILGAAWRTFLGVRAIADADKFAEKQFGVPKTDHAHKALALRCGVFNLQAALLQVAAASADMKTTTKRNLHAAMAVNNFSSAALAQYNVSNNKLNSKDAQMRTLVTVALGAYAAVAAFKENQE